ncbi:hypothetical protein [Actinoplanes palleronii]|uniref:DUF4351 domain-containing protein n=1 Tax=Actinoplanes palleronii TaxID=113570 RepID=A0ABQ4B0X5_9ACTN|nr:hypothetical protein [Actinoplanes palleronii]GIE64319.1 hypothetical protein Apa02nite_004270 [Actinoplanes palleronii]
MGNFLEETEAGREIAQKYLERGIKEGLKQQFEQGYKQSLVRSMRLVLQTRFGDIPGLDELAAALVAADHDANLVRVVNGVPLDQLQQP